MLVTDMKVCTTCKKNKSIEEYYFRKDTQKYKKECKSCAVKRSKKNRKEDAYLYDRERHLKITYNLTIEEYDAILEEQDGRCAICLEDNPRGKGRFHVDHNHSTGEIRGLLCQTCNQGIGLLKDNPDTLLKAAQYLIEKGYGEK